MIHDYIAGKWRIKCSFCAILTYQAASIDLSFVIQSGGTGQSKRNQCRPRPQMMTPTQSIADNTEAALIIDERVRYTPLFAFSFTNGSIIQPSHLDSLLLRWLEQFGDSWAAELKG